jgi:hypothetical protein
MQCNFPGTSQKVIFNYMDGNKLQFGSRIFIRDIAIVKSSCSLAVMEGGSSENLSIKDQDSFSSVDHPQGVLPNLDLYQIEEASESRPSTREQETGRWAVTQQAQHVHKVG